MTRTCHYCGAALPDIRLGVRLTALQARIFDLVQRGGGDGILGADLIEVLGDRERPMTRNTLHVHVCGINGLIEDEGYRITGNARGSRGFYRLVHFTPPSPRRVMRRCDRS